MTDSIMYHEGNRRLQDRFEYLGETGFGAGAFSDLFNQRGDGSGHGSRLPAGPLH